MTRQARALLRPQVQAPAPDAADDGQLKTEDEKDGAELIAEERARQISAEGWMPEHDDTHTTGELTDAAVCYVLAGDGISLKGWSVARATQEMLDFVWPWDREWAKPDADPVRNYVKAGALIAAEIDRLRRREDSTRRRGDAETAEENTEK